MYCRHTRVLSHVPYQESDKDDRTTVQLQTSFVLQRLSNVSVVRFVATPHCRETDREGKGREKTIKSVSVFVFVFLFVYV